MPLALHSSIATIASVSILIRKPAKGVGFVLALKCEGRRNTDMLITHVTLTALNRLSFFFFLDCSQIWEEWTQFLHITVKITF